MPTFSIYIFCLDTEDKCLLNTYNHCPFYLKRLPFSSNVVPSFKLSLRADILAKTGFLLIFYWIWVYECLCSRKVFWFWMVEQWHRLGCWSFYEHQGHWKLRRWSETDCWSIVYEVTDEIRSNRWALTVHQYRSLRRYLLSGHKNIHKYWDHIYVFI